jgi:hypothetical protein
MSCHGATFTDPTTGKPAVMKVKVDTFTTAKFGCPVATHILNMKNFTLFDEAHTYFIPKILKGIRTLGPSPDKDAVRKIITDSLCHARDQDGVFVADKCKFKCHKMDDPLSTTMADISILGPGPCIPETVFSVDLTTGAKEDVHETFGLELVQPDFIYPPGNPKQPDPFFRRALDDYSFQTTLLAGQPDKKAEHRRRCNYSGSVRKNIGSILKSADYRYAHLHHDKYVPISGYRYPMIKLSDVIDIAIKNGTINPKTDFVILQVCRTFDGQLPPGTASPGRPNSQVSVYASEGGRKRRKMKMITKNRNNRNKNKTKHKTKHNANANNNTKNRKRKTIRRT